MDKILTVDELIAILREEGTNYRYSQIHHTYSPSHKNFNGVNHLELQQGMRNFHMNVRGWDDIGQHVTLMPDGTFVTGRDFKDDNVDFNDIPAGVTGYNTGAFMTEILGNFDIGNDKLEGDQLDSILKLNHYLINEAGAEILFHREKAAKSCPGTGIDKSWFVQAVMNYKHDQHVKVVTPPKTEVAGVTTKPKANLTVDGELGPLTIKALQIYFGTPVDGVISRPSMLVKAIQKWLGVKVDGYLGPITISALQRYLGTPIDGVISKVSLMVKELQRRLNKGQL